MNKRSMRRWAALAVAGATVGALAACAPSEPAEGDGVTLWHLLDRAPPAAANDEDILTQLLALHHGEPVARKLADLALRIAADGNGSMNESPDPVWGASRPPVLDLVPVPRSGEGA